MPTTYQLLWQKEVFISASSAENSARKCSASSSCIACPHSAEKPRAYCPSSSIMDSP